MSSFHQKNLSIDTQEIQRDDVALPCPECGKVALHQIKSDCTLEDGIFIPNLSYYFCNSCKSKYFDDAAMGVIESYRNNS